MPSFAIASIVRRRYASQFRREPAAGIEQRRGLAIDHVDIVGQRRSRVVTEPALHHFAFGELDAGLRRCAYETFLEAAGDFERAAEQIVARDQRRAESVAREGRRLAAAQQAAIDDVVVEQRCGMDQLERDCGVDRLVDSRVGSAACAIHQHDEGRTQPLAAGVDEVVANFRDDRFFRVEQARQLRFDCREVGFDEARGIQRLRRRCGGELSGLGSFHLFSVKSYE